MSDDDSIRVQLARMEGKMDVANERLETSNRINEERHVAIQARLGTIDQRLHTHGNRIQILEANNHKKEGERAGLSMAGKWIWIAAGLVPTALVAAVLRAMGA